MRVLCVAGGDGVGVDHQRRLNLDPGFKGVLIASVDQSSDAALRGLRKDDILVQANGEPVTTAALAVS